MTGLLGNLLLREVPAALAAGVSNGQYEVYGSIIRSVAGGRIVGHLQEAGGLTQLASLAVQTPFAPVKLAAGIIGDGIQIIQNEQIKSGIAMLSQLGVANLALGAVGIGVSIAGFAVVSRKIDRVKAEVAALGAKVDAIGLKIDALQGDAVARELDDLCGLAKLNEEGWEDEADLASRRWHKVAEETPRLSVGFERRARSLLNEGPTKVAAAEPLLDALSMASALRVGCLAATGNCQAARRAAVEAAQTLDSLTSRIGLADLTRACLLAWKVQPGTTDWGHALDRAAKVSRIEAGRLRDREAAAATRGAFLPELEMRGIQARDWLAAARQERHAPLLLMTTAT